MTYNEFKNKYNGRLLDYDGSYGGQCWDLAQYYFTKCLELPANILSGCGYVGNMLKEPKLSLLLKYFDEVPTTNMYPGDVVIWEKHHIAIFDNWDGKSCWYLSQNNAGTGENPKGATEITRVGLSGVARAFRKKGTKKEESKPIIKYLNISPEADYRTIYKNTTLTPENSIAKIKPKKYGGLSYKILKDCGNNIVKIKTDMFGEGYISSKEKYYCTVDDKPKYKHGCY